MKTKIFSWLLPQWAKNPLLAYHLLHDGAENSWRSFVKQTVLIAVLIVGASLVYAHVTGLAAVSQSFTVFVWQSLYFPALALQALTTIAALVLGANAFDSHASSLSWDNLRVTEIGAGLALRARWLSILYRLRAPITVILLVRLALALGILSDLTAFGGNYASMLGADAVMPPPSWLAALILIALNMAASAVLPLVSVAFAGAIGILFGVAIKERLFAVLIQAVLTVALIVLVASASLAAAQVLQGSLALPDLATFLLFLGYSTAGDWGLSLMQLDSLEAVWQRTPYGVSIGLGLSGYIILQALLADGVMWLAERICERQS